MNHIVLDFEHNSKSSNYWASNFLNQKQSPVFLNNVSLDLKYTNNFHGVEPSFLGNKRYTLVLPTNSLDKYSKHNVFNTLKGLRLIESGFLNKNSSVFNLINVNFVRKERVYTKLKYSRTPGYDIVSGGSAVILAGFLGFLVSEKFGIELVDSGDFYYLWMYIVFLCFSVRPLLVTASHTQSLWSLLSLRYLLNFITTLITLIIKFVKSFLR